MMFAFLLLTVAACSDGIAGDDSAAVADAVAGRAFGEATSVRTVSGDQSGNRTVDGSIDLGDRPLEVALDSPARWIVSGVSEVGPVFLVVSDDGSVTSLVVEGDDVVAAQHGTRNPETPFLLASESSDFWIVEAPVGSSDLTAPAVVGDKLISTTLAGVVTIDAETESIVVDVVALGDSRFAIDDVGRVAVLSDPTNAYPHGVVGDRVEASTATVFDADDGAILGVAVAPEGTVFETVAPMWADIDDDGVSELVLTASDASSGARLLAYSWDGVLLAAAPPIGNGQRWRNLLGVASFGDELRIVDVQTPHIGGIVQWFEVDGDLLNKVAGASEFSTHRIGSRNLDQGLIIDGDGDGTVDVVVPNQRQDAISVLRLDGTAVSEVETVPLAARLSSNLTAVATGDGRAMMAAGLTDGTVLIWR